MHSNGTLSKPQGFAPQMVRGIHAFSLDMKALNLALLSTLTVGINLLAAAQPREPDSQRGGNAPPASLAGIIREATRRYLYVDAARAGRHKLV